MLGYILFGLFIILVMKTVRDVISFRYDISIFTRLPGWIQEFINDPEDKYGSFDGWHVADALIIAVSWILIMWFFIGSFWKALATYIIFWIIFYQLFRFFYHWLFTLPEYRDYKKSK